jgi:hypothetical protein
VFRPGPANSFSVPLFAGREENEADKSGLVHSPNFGRKLNRLARGTCPEHLPADLAIRRENPNGLKRPQN